MYVMLRCMMINSDVYILLYHFGKTGCYTCPWSLVGMSFSA